MRTQIVEEVDRDAFMIFCDASQVLGEGFGEITQGAAGIPNRKPERSSMRKDARRKKREMRRSIRAEKRISRKRKKQ